MKIRYLSGCKKPNVAWFFSQMIINDTPSFKNLMAKIQEITDKINSFK
ncbi:MAG: hypothetical protein LBN95_09150 [Prevotellaceae bacterium]|nr:hypothetical protein [Prevotellaceae bacterium]